jgi:lysozyme
MLQGVDLDDWQGAPGQWHDAAGDIDWAAVKLTELQPGGGRYVNPDAAADLAYLKDNGKGRIAYLFGHPSMSAADTVSFFVATLDTLRPEDTDGIGIDLETNDGWVTPPAVSEWAREVAADLTSQLDRLPVDYSYLSFIQGGNFAGCDAYPLWISAPSYPQGKPPVPAPWPRWAIQQYDISGPIDRDVADYPTLEAMQAALGKRAAPKQTGKVVRWETTGHWSLNREASEHRTTAAVMLDLAKREHHVYGRPMSEYVDRGDFNALLPAGTWLFAYA